MGQPNSREGRRKSSNSAYSPERNATNNYTEPSDPYKKASPNFQFQPTSTSQYKDPSIQQRNSRNLSPNTSQKPGAGQRTSNQTKDQSNSYIDDQKLSEGDLYIRDIRRVNGAVHFAGDLLSLKQAEKGAIPLHGRPELGIDSYYANGDYALMESKKGRRPHIDENFIMNFQDLVDAFNRNPKLASLDEVIQNPKFQGDRFKTLIYSNRSNGEYKNMEQSSMRKGDSKLMRNLTGRSSEEAGREIDHNSGRSSRRFGNEVYEEPVRDVYYDDQSRGRQQRSLDERRGTHEQYEGTMNSSRGLERRGAHEQYEGMMNSSSRGLKTSDGTEGFKSSGHSNVSQREQQMALEFRQGRPAENPKQSEISQVTTKKAPHQYFGFAKHLSEPLNALKESGSLGIKARGNTDTLNSDTGREQRLTQNNSTANSVRKTPTKEPVSKETSRRNSKSPAQKVEKFDLTKSSSKMASSKGTKNNDLGKSGRTISTERKREEEAKSKQFKETATSRKMQESNNSSKSGSISARGDERRNSGMQGQVSRVNKSPSGNKVQQSKPVQSKITKKPDTQATKPTQQQAGKGGKPSKNILQQENDFGQINLSSISESQIPVRSDFEADQTSDDDDDLQPVHATLDLSAFLGSTKAGASQGTKSKGQVSKTSTMSRGNEKSPIRDPYGQNKPGQTKDTQELKVSHSKVSPRQESRQEQPKGNTQSKMTTQQTQPVKGAKPKNRGDEQMDDEQQFLDSIRDKFDRLNDKSEKMLSITNTNQPPVNRGQQKSKSPASSVQNKYFQSSTRNATTQQGSKVTGKGVNATQARSKSPY